TSENPSGPGNISGNRVNTVMLKVMVFSLRLCYYRLMSQESSKNTAKELICAMRDTLMGYDKSIEALEKIQQNIGEIRSVATTLKHLKKQSGNMEPYLNSMESAYKLALDGTAPLNEKVLEQNARIF